MYVAVIVCVAILLAVYMLKREGFASGARTVTLHFTTWCPACKHFRPIWDAVRGSVQGVNFVEVDEGKTPTADITKYPTVRMVDERGLAHEYSGMPEYSTLRTWVLAPAFGGDI